MWYRLTDGKEHDYIIRQMKPFVNSELGQALGLDYKKLMRGNYKSIYIKHWDNWRHKAARTWNSWTFYQIMPGDFKYFDLKVNHVIDLNKLRNSTIKQVAGKKVAKEIRVKRKEKKVKKILGNSWSDCFKL